MNFEIQRFATDYSRNSYDSRFTGRRRLSGNYGRLYISLGAGTGTGQNADEEVIPVFEVNAFNAKIIADRDDVIVGISKDSKIVSLTGEGEFTVKYVYDRGFTQLVKDWAAGHDTRITLIGTLADPDAIGYGEEKIKIVDCWINEMEIMNFEKGSVVERTIPFGFAPDLVTFPNSIKYESAKGQDLTGKTSLALTQTLQKDPDSKTK